MRQNPVRIVRHFSRVFTKDGNFIKETPLVFTVQARLLGITTVNTTKGPRVRLYIECGHDHKTETAAQPCLRRLKRRYIKHRSRLGRLARARMLTKNLLSTEVMKRKSLLLGPLGDLTFQADFPSGLKSR
jgi:hypothetical protein